MTVTLNPKRYIFVCAGCGCLDESERSDALTCSNACRVKAHRSGNLKRLRAAAKELEVSPAAIQQSKAAASLVLDAYDRIMSRRDTLDTMRDEVARAFDRLLLEHAR